MNAPAQSLDAARTDAGRLVAVLADDPAQADVWLLLGDGFVAAGQGAQAETAWRRALVVDPGRADAWTRLIPFLQNQGRLTATLEACLALDALQPDRLEALILASDCARSLCRFDALATVTARLEAKLAQAAALADWRPLSSLLYRHLFMPLSDDVWTRLARRVDQALNAQAAAEGGPFPRPSSIRPLTPGRRLRIGFASANFGDHPIGHVALSLFAALDRGRFEVLGFSRHDRRGEPGPYAARLEAGFDRLHQIGHLSPAEMARFIRDLGVDILVEIDGHMDKRGLETLAFRPAPVAAYWLGHAGGLGLSTVDWLIADAVTIPPGEEGAYAERVIRLPDVYHCADRHPIAASAGSRADWGLPADGFVFCAFNNIEKITAPVLALWMEILRRTPGSVLWLSTAARAVDRVANLRRLAQAHGVDPARLVCAERVTDKAMHLARHRLADLFLDTAVINASTTALDALWAGLPVLTTPGERFSGRIAAAMLTGLRLPELIRADAADFVNEAVRLAHDPAALAGLKARLAQALTTAPLFDVHRFARHLETALTTMWRVQVEGEPSPSAAVYTGGP